MSPSIHPDKFYTSLQLPQGSRRILVGYSGGVDSHVLLDLLGQIRDRLNQELVAVHVNHGLNAGADEWARHCRDICTGLGVEFVLINLDARPPRGESPEAWARKLRYEAISELLGKDDLLVTAHHRDDMAETLLLQLFRGAGPAGLASMPLLSSIQKGWHGRPLLGHARTQILEYARLRKLSWIEDSSNQSRRFDRNYLRLDIMPALKEHWPGITDTLTRSARLQAEASQLLDDLASTDLHTCTAGAHETLPVAGLVSLPRYRAANLLRYWIKLRGHALPSAVLLDRILDEVITARLDAEPCVSWQGTEIHRYRTHLYIMAPLPVVGQDAVILAVGEECLLPLGRLKLSHTEGNGISAELCSDAQLSIRYRRGGEVIKRGGHHHSLKNLFQESAVPAFYRDHVPLVYVEDRLVAVTGLCIDEDFQAVPGEPAIALDWSGASQVYGTLRD